MLRLAFDFIITWRETRTRPNAYLITPIPYNSQKTIDCISLLIENEKLRKEMAKEAMCKAKCFTIDSVITRWYNLFEEVL